MSTSSTQPRTLVFSLGVILAAVALAAAGVAVSRWQTAQAAGILTITTDAAYNLVVDSNVLSPSTEAPQVATVMGKYCNTGDAPLTNVQAYIGDYNSTTPATSTPGIYPRRWVSDTGFNTAHPVLYAASEPGTYYSFTHMGGTLGVRDATRYIGTLAAGQCVTEYWHFTYPRLANDLASNDDSGDAPVWGQSNDPLDDLWLTYDLWGTSSAPTPTSITWKMTMRNEISAMANKILPNTGQWYSSVPANVAPGQLITITGVGYNLGAVNKGFDNDLVPYYDYNAWLQPIGDPLYDPTCFRMIRSTGVLTISRGSIFPDVYRQFIDRLYFTHPEILHDNTNVTGNVNYTFVALQPNCTAAMSPYQEAASGADNEKFNGDYGTGVPPLTSGPSTVTLSKNAVVIVSPLVPGGSIGYTVSFANTGAVKVGDPALGVPVIISDTIPAGTTLAGTPAPACTVTGGGTTTIIYSSNGINWSTTAPSPTRFIGCQLNQSFPAGATGSLTFQATVSNPLTASPWIKNLACLSFGFGVPAVCDDTDTPVSGSNTIGDFVWRDLDGDAFQDGGSETGIDGVKVSLYWDTNGNGLYDTGDMLMGTQDTSGGGAYSFTSLPNGSYLVVVDYLDPQIPAGYSATTSKVQYVKDLGSTSTGTSYLQADFGFGPSLVVDKQLTSTTPTTVGQLVTYQVSVRNTRPGNGSGTGSTCEYYAWPSALDPIHDPSIGSMPGKPFVNPGNAVGVNGPDGAYAMGSLASGAGYRVAGTSWGMTPGIGTIQNVYAFYRMRVTTALVAGQTRLSGKYWYRYDTANSHRVQYDFDVTAVNAACLNQWCDVYFDVTTIPYQPGWGDPAPSGWTWTWADFTSAVVSNVDIAMELDKISGNPSSAIDVDAMGFRIVTNGTCGGSADTIVTAPMTDTYDADLLQFVSASPAQSSVWTTGSYPNTVGYVHWDNLGPVYAGETQTVNMTFRALAPSGGATQDEVCVSNTRWNDGTRAGDDCDPAEVTINDAAVVGDTVCVNLDGNGCTPGEPGIPNVTLRLYNTADCTGSYTTQTTNSTGFYLFTGVTAGTHCVAVDPATVPTGYTINYDLLAPLDGSSGSFTTDGTASKLDVDFGYEPTLTGEYTIGDTVYTDWDGDGVLDAGETGIANVTVWLYNASNLAVAMDVTDANGVYGFSGLVAGSYTVKVDAGDIPVTYAQTGDPDETGTCTTCDSQGSSTVGPNDDTVDFGYRPLGYASLGDFVWRDLDGDGVQDGGSETGIANVTVRLYHDADNDGVLDAGSDALVATTVTSAGGLYLFQNLAADNYLVQVDTSDPDFPTVGGAYPWSPTTGTTNPRAVTLTTYQDYRDADFGFRALGVIGDRIWQDYDGDAVQDAGEPGISGVDVTLYVDVNDNGVYDAGTDTLYATDTTDASGIYLFTDLPADRYVVVVNTADITSGWVQTYDPDAIATDPPCASGCNNQAGVLLYAGQSDRTNDFGYRSPGLIGDMVWIDSDGDGTRDWFEEGIGGVLMELRDGTCVPGSTCRTTYTDSEGVYTFGNLDVNNMTYTVVVVSGIPTGLTQTYDPDEANPCTSCDGQGTTTLTTSAPTDRGVDFGYQYNACTISGTVFYDAGADGGLYGGVPDLPRATVVVYLFDSTSELVGTAVTDASTGAYNYMFGAPSCTGTYTVKVDTGSLALDGMHQTADPNISGRACTGAECDNQYSVTFTGSSVSDIDFGYYPDVALDYGDLPATYATMSEAGGAAHEPGTLYLGTTAPDTEANGQPTADATGDGADEDGVRLTPSHDWSGTTGSIDVWVSSPGYVSGWIDWNDDGDFEDAYERVLADKYVSTAGAWVPYTFPIYMPPYRAQYVYARFRIYTASDVGLVSPTGTIKGGEVEDYYWDSTTPVTLSYFRVGDAGDGKLQFKWTTSLEVGNLGFQLYAYTPDGAVALNDGLIPSRSVDALAPQDYEYTLAWDQAADAKAYYLADVDIFGRTRMHGPFAPNEDYGAQVKPEPIDWAAIQAEHAAQAQTKAPVQAYAPGRKVNLQVRTTGLYRVTYEQLKAAGFDWAGANAQHLALTSHGRRVPITVSCGAVFAPGCYVEFYGEALDTMYTDTNVYTLLVDRAQALRIAVDGSAIRPGAVPQAYYMETATFGADRGYDFAAPGADPWYDTQMLVYRTPVTRTFAANIDAYVAGAAPATLGVGMWGGTDWPQSPDHHVVVRFNGTTVADELFNGLENHPVQVTLPAGLLHAGANQLQLVLPGDTGVAAEVVSLDEYRITYPRAPIARDGRLTFQAAGRVMRVEGLPAANVVVYRLNALGTPVRISQVRVESTGATYRATFPGTITGTPVTYVVSAAQAVRAPVVTAARPAVDIKSGTAQYLVIAHGDFVAGIQPLVAYHQGRGMTTRVVDVADVYAQFGYGIFGPQAIRDYIRYAVTNMGTEYVLLVGGDTYDYRNYLGYGSLSFMPSLYARTDAIVAYAPVDAVYADVDGDNAPEVALGRLPVRTNAELDVLVAKTLAYAVKDYGGTGVFAADATDGSLVFMNDSEAFVAQLPAGWTVQKAYIDVSGLAGARATLLNAMNGGVALTSYVGHSDLDIWSFSGLFTTADAAALTNAGRPTVVTQWGCWNTYYVSPVYNTLAHQFLLSGDRGAAAVLGASALTESSSEQALGLLVMPRLTQPGTSMGMAVQDAKAQLALTNPGLLDVLLGWTLLGDPALVVTP